MPDVTEAERKEGSYAYVQLTSDHSCKCHVPGFQTSARIDAVPAIA